MDEIVRVFERYGKLWRPPQACKAGSKGDWARWTVIRDGLREVIEHLPLGHRAEESKLQDAWMYAAHQAELLEEEPKGEWLIPS